MYCCIVYCVCSLFSFVNHILCASLCAFTFYDLVGDTSGGLGQLFFLKYYWLFGLFYTPHFLQVSKSIVNMMFYSLFIPSLFCVNIFDSHSFIIT